MSAPPLDQFHDPFDERYDRVADDPPYLAPDLPTSTPNQLVNAQQRIEELEMATFAALQAQADMEYCLEMEERRRRIERQNNATVHTQPVIIDRVVRQPIIVKDDWSFMRNISLLKSGLILVLVIVLCICVTIVVSLSINRN